MPAAAQANGPPPGWRKPRGQLQFRQARAMRSNSTKADTTPSTKTEQLLRSLPLALTAIARGSLRSCDRRPRRAAHGLGGRIRRALGGRVRGQDDRRCRPRPGRKTGHPSLIANPGGRPGKARRQYRRRRWRPRFGRRWRQRPPASAALAQTSNRRGSSDRDRCGGSSARQHEFRRQRSQPRRRRATRLADRPSQQQRRAARERAALCPG